EGLRLERGQQTGRLLGLAERRLEHLASAVADDADTDALPGLAQADRGAQGACVADGVVVDADDDVVDAKTRGRGGGAGAHAVDERAERRAEPATRRELGRDARDADAERAAPYLARIDQLAHHVAGHIDRDRESDADVAAVAPD